jgi:hypothetical protein
MNAEPEHLASAYLDGELTDEERRLADRDPTVMAEVESLRALRAEIAAVEPPSSTARETAISAAMAEFHQLHGTTDPAATPEPAPADQRQVVPFQPRREHRDLSRWLGVAAALVVAAALGIVAVQAGGGGDSDDSAADEPASETVSANRVPQADDLDAGDEPAEDLMTVTEMAEDDLAADGATAEDAGGGDVESALADEAEAAEPSEAVEEAMTAEATAEESGSADSAVTGPAPSTVPLPDPALYFEDDLPIESPNQLQSAAWYLIAQRDAGELGPTPEYRCPVPFVLDRALYRVGDDVFEVLIDVDELVNVVSAVDEPTCNVIASSPIETDDQP